MESGERHNSKKRDIITKKYNKEKGDYMKRFIENKLIEWKSKLNRKPLLINGIRQVGKTWSVKQFGQLHFSDFIYLNFDLEPGYCEIFKRTKDPSKIIYELSILFERKIDIKKTLIFFDEIQSCNEALSLIHI